MTEQFFTIKITEEKAQRMREIAHLAGEPIEAVISELLPTRPESEIPGDRIDKQLKEVNQLSNIRLWVLVEAGLNFPESLDTRMLALIQKSKDSNTTDIEKVELEMLNDLYNKYVLLRAKALAELKKRGQDVSSFFEVSEY